MFLRVTQDRHTPSPGQSQLQGSTVPISTGLLGQVSLCPPVSHDSLPPAPPLPQSQLAEYCSKYEGFLNLPQETSFRGNGILHGFIFYKHGQLDHRDVLLWNCWVVFKSLLILIEYSFNPRGNHLFLTFLTGLTFGVDFNVLTSKLCL